MSVRPATFTRGFGSESVIGLIRVPRPAAKTIAVFGTARPRRIVCRDGSWNVGRFGRQESAGQVALVPARKRLKGKMSEILREITPDTRQVT